MLAISLLQTIRRASLSDLVWAGVVVAVWRRLFGGVFQTIGGHGQLEPSRVLRYWRCHIGAGGRPHRGCFSDWRRWRIWLPSPTYL